MRALILYPMLVLCAAFSSCGKKEEPVAAAVVVAPPPVAATVEEGIAAVLRAHPNSRKVCYETNYDGYLLDYGPPLAAGVEPDGLFHGWYLLQRVQLYRSSNGTWFTGLQPDKEYVTVYPDASGLPCKAH